jgi:hypothetical protein
MNAFAGLECAEPLVPHGRGAGRSPVPCSAILGGSIAATHLYGCGCVRSMMGRDCGWCGLSTGHRVGGDLAADVPYTAGLISGASRVNGRNPTP